MPTILWHYSTIKMIFSNFAKNLAKKPKLTLFLIVILGIFLRLIFFSGMDVSDSLEYSKTAYDIKKGITQSSVPTLSTRLGLIYPTAVSYKIFGISDFSSVLFVLLTSIASIVLIFYFGKLLFDIKAGLFAAVLLSFFPLNIVDSTKLLSDLPSAFFVALGVYIFLYAELKSKLKHGISYLLSGIFIGIGYLIRESALLIALFFIAYILYKRRIKREYFLVPIGVLIIFLSESLIFFSLTGDPLFRVHTSQDYLAKSTIAHDYFGRLDFPKGLLHYPYMILTDNLISVYYILIFISILLLSFFISEKKANYRNLITLLLIFLTVASVVVVYLKEDRNRLKDLRLAYDYIKNLDKTIYIDDRSVKALAYIDKYSNSIKPNEYPKDLSGVRNSYIIINKRMIKGLKDANKNRIFPDEIEDPPKKWELVNEIGLNDEDKIMIYYAP